MKKRINFFLKKKPKDPQGEQKNRSDLETPCFKRKSVDGKTDEKFSMEIPPEKPKEGKPKK